MTLITFAYLFSAAAFGLLAIALVFGRRFDWPFNYLLLMCGLFVVWSVTMVLGVRDSIEPTALLANDALHAFAATMFLGQLIGRRSSDLWQQFFLYGPWLIPPVVMGIFVFAGTDSPTSLTAMLYLNVGLSLVGLLAVEQIFRNSGMAKRKVASFIALSFGLIFVFDLFVYSNGIIGQSINIELWAARGLVNGIAAPLIFLSLKRDADWRSGFFVSRQVVFYSASLMGVGVYLILIAFGGALVQQMGGEWGAALKVIFIVIAVVALVLVIFSRGLQRRLKVFLATHFYSNRYDYREEWLKLIGRLAQDSDRAPMPVLCLEAMADIIDGDGGALWLKDAGNSKVFRIQANVAFRVTESELSSDHALIAFLAETGWVVDGLQATETPEHYKSALVSVADFVGPDALFVPLMLDDSLTGFFYLNRPRGMQALNFEDHDLLRTVGRQMAVFLEQSRVQQQLTQARQFEVFNRFSAFVMHDLKNLIAQQSLVVSNAKKFKGNPEFVEDAIGTIENSVKRMNRLLEQLQTGKTSGTSRTVDVVDLVKQVCQSASDRSPVPQLSVEVSSRLPLFGDAEKLQTAIYHLLRNAQDATPANGSISVVITGVSEAGTPERDKPHHCRVLINDTGSGMSEEFIEKHLFEPFYSTKGAQGMGVGMYQARDHIESLGGRLTVDSEVGQGTSMIVELPLTFSIQASTAST
ncbi:MAG: XrtA/PEP-CTERM system histidine kinase PrsK [Woeseiaceae bacterium]